MHPMAAVARNLVNLKSVRKGFGSRSVLEDLTLGISEGDRIGVVGRNGDGKSTLLRLVAGAEEPDAGAVTRTGGVTLELLGQGDTLDPARTIRQELVGGRADHEWAGDPEFRAVLDGLLGGIGLDRFGQGMDTPIAPLSGGERRRIALARLLLGHPDLLLLDEPTNHLDVEAVDWLARHLAARRGTLVVVTHDRWFLDEVCTATWEVADGAVHRYEGGYAAYVLARAERERQQAARDDRRTQLLRKELAWLRRGPPARTAKPSSASRPPTRSSPTSPRSATAWSSCASPPPAWATRCSTPSTSGWRSAPRCSCATRPGAWVRAIASRSSGSTGRARRRSSGSWPACSSPRPGGWSAGRPCAWRTCPRTPRRSRATCGCSSRSSRSAGARR
jgi:ABC-type nitrate/sulfonate/bicarbonate transport system ATPase subunit